MVDAVEYLRECGVFFCGGCRAACGAFFDGGGV